MGACENSRYNGVMINTVLPGAELITRGFVDLENGVVSIESLLVSMASPRLETLALPLPTSPLISPELTLYRMLEEQYGLGAHSKYNAYVRRLVSFLRAAECERSSTRSD